MATRTKSLLSDAVLAPATTNGRRSGSATLEPELEPNAGATYSLPTATRPIPAIEIAPATPREPFPLVLQRRAPEALRTHARRSALRIAVLLASDGAVALTLRAVYRGLGIYAWLGEPTASITRALVPPGTFPIPQLLCATVLGLAVIGNYRSGDWRRNPVRLLCGTALGLGLVFWPQLWARAPWPTWIGFALVTSALGAGIVATRLLLDAIVRRVRPASQRVARTLVIGTSDIASQVLQCRALRRSCEYQIVGFLDLQLASSGDAQGRFGEVASIIETQRVDTIVLAGVANERHFNQIVNIADAAGCQVQAVPVEFLWRGALEPELIRRRGTPIVQFTRPAARSSQLIAKRCLDLSLSAAALALLAPFLIGIGIIIRLTSSGPALFKQTRVGRGGRRFFIYKFRTMVANADSHREKLAAQSMYGDLRLFKMECDPRVTSIGAILRRTSLDELPQLWNVLRGDMSLVGPRPPMPSEVELYEEHHYSRFDMKPGITGPWQVNGRNEITDFEEVVRLETRYMRHWSLTKDVSILLRTLPVVLRMRGAH